MHAVADHYESLRGADEILQRANTVISDDWQLMDLYRRRDQLTRGIDVVETAFWLSEHLQRGTIEASEVSPDTVQKVLASGEHILDRVTSRPANVSGKEQARNYQIAATVLRTFITDRPSFDFEQFSDLYSGTIASSLAHRIAEYKRQHLESVLGRRPSRNEDGVVPGAVFEMMLCGMIAENEEFRGAKVFGIPAAHELERGRILGKFIPIDVALFAVEEDSTTSLIGGIQATTDMIRPDGFTSVIRRHKSQEDTPFNGPLAMHIEQWCAGEGLAQYHGYLFDQVLASGNKELISRITNG